MARHEIVLDQIRSDEIPFYELTGCDVISRTDLGCNYIVSYEISCG